MPESNVPPLLLALDFGGTKHAAAVLRASEKRWSAHRRAFSPPNANATTDLEIMRSLIHDLLQDSQPAAIGVSFGGPVDASTGTVRLSHHVPGWENIPLASLLSKEFGVAVSVDNDANVAALGEHRFGAGQGCDSLMYITVSTGVGGGWILNGRPWRGADGMAGEIGHTVVDPKGPLCLCGKRGCLERLASGPYMAQQVRETMQRSPSRGQGVRHFVGNDLEAITGEIVSRAATQGDELAREVLETAGWALGVSIGNAANLINPQQFVLGGGVTKAGANFWEVVRRVARETALPEVNFEIVPAALGDEAPLWGAVALANDLMSFS
ncbi:MAG: ROK family protein [Myxacorys chilensis ATA2-1-KO14]|nr:ROK family protein [Myxacorys chilensis ATA2-1-KO14]